MRREQDDSMKSTTVTELRGNIASWLDRVQVGQEVVIVRDGEPVAKLVPMESPQVAAERRLARVRQTAVIGDIISPVSEQDWELA